MSVATEKTAQEPFSFKVVQGEIAKLIQKDLESRDNDESDKLFKFFRDTTPLLEELRKQIATSEKELQEMVRRHSRTTLITKAVEPREIRVLARGNWMDDTGEVVEPGVPHFLSQIERPGRATRLDLANWLVSKNNPLTARVFVNRLWKLFFGTGLSKVLDDVGSQGELPSHPELLDALAIEFVESGWDVKHMIRLIVTSSTYRRASIADLQLVANDPYNRSLARQSRYRLDAELIRDNALAISGLLVTEFGGRSAKPYQPEGLYRHLNFPARTYKHDQGINQYRRGVYTHWQRQFLHPAMQSFDAPSREECTAERPRSNTPLAALVLLNDPSYVEAARVFAMRAVNAEPQKRERIDWMMRQALSREADPDEADVLLELVEQENSYFQSNSEAARQLVAVGDSELEPDVNASELATWTAVARAIFNMHEMITRN